MLAGLTRLLKAQYPYQSQGRPNRGDGAPMVLGCSAPDGHGANIERRTAEGKTHGRSAAASSFLASWDAKTTSETRQARESMSRDTTSEPQPHAGGSGAWEGQIGCG
jgi:hypothetical protein